MIIAIQIRCWEVTVVSMGVSDLPTGYMVIISISFARK